MDDLGEQPPACWICGAPADSAEHRIKKADLVRVYGKGPYRGDAAPVHIRGGVQTSIQGPGSAAVKYRPSLCQRCNTTATQPYDRAYDQLISWVVANESAVLRKRLIDFGEVYGSSFEEEQRNLFKYFVKNIGCRLVDARESVPRDLVELLPRETFRTKLAITFCVNEDILLLPAWRSDFIGKGELLAFSAHDNPTIATSYQWNEHVSWFTVYYWYGRPPDGGLGPKWIADAQFIYLGSSSPLTPEQRADLIAKVAEDESDANSKCGAGS